MRFIVVEQQTSPVALFRGGSQGNIGVCSNVSTFFFVGFPGSGLARFEIHIRLEV